MSIEQIFVSIGSNIDDREAHLAGAITILGEYDENTELRSASFYETDPLYNPNQPKFLNTVVELYTTFTPFEFLDEIHKVEKLLGRPNKREKYSPRTIDIDILTFGDSILETDELSIPHSGIPFRKFVLVPFNELAPNLLVPGWKLSVNELLQNCSDESKVVKHKLESNA